ncbi:5-formyltetrahydrofolate cyclo-ligase [Lactobacillus ultunensis DSM 16047]|uniref:5-formyltetrahydrofolate cyclo-ligase n=2 Tax=Lactobacillus ultunensis TaxID=227945 RepID=C2EKR6_9LACO|nr:5-formyltetrahydrofolate cyclo-ligase [Lactobacillus ultunensis DSM 16047]KRL83075.1 5-formyltetrahydrofolate cyclo-ligase [Lactobacillus ultunensis DSM 16047]
MFLGKNMQKSELRKKQTAKLKEFANTKEKKTEDSILLEKLLETELVKNSQTIGITASLPFEVDTSELTARLWDAGKEVYLAKARNDQAHTLDFLHYTYMSKLQKSSFGVEEIADADAAVKNELDLVIVPGLAFALDSHVRLGFGGGYYDRFLAKHKCQTVSLVNTPMQFATSEWPIEKTDMPIQTIVTTDKIY